MTEHVDFFMFKELFEMHLIELIYNDLFFEGDPLEERGKFIYGEYLKFLNDLSSQIKKEYSSKIDNEFLDFLHQEINLMEIIIEEEEVEKRMDIFERWGNPFESKAKYINKALAIWVADRNFSKFAKQYVKTRKPCPKKIENVLNLLRQNVKKQETKND
jgi:hypothetical protein